MSEYTPTLREVRERFIDGFPIDTWVVARDDAGRDFDRWLAEHDREVAAKALRDHRAAIERWYESIPGMVPKSLVFADLGARADALAAPEQEGKNDE